MLTQDYYFIREALVSPTLARELYSEPCVTKIEQMWISAVHFHHLIDQLFPNFN